MSKHMKANNIKKRLSIWAGVVAIILLIPLLFKWPWTFIDFIVIGVLIFGTGLAYELITKIVGKKYRIIIAVVLLVAFLLVWVELAVGLFGAPFAGS